MVDIKVGQIWLHNSYKWVVERQHPTLEDMYLMSRGDEKGWSMLRDNWTLDKDVAAQPPVEPVEIEIKVGQIWYFSADNRNYRVLHKLPEHTLFDLCRVEETNFVITRSPKGIKGNATLVTDAPVTVSDEPVKVEAPNLPKHPHTMNPYLNKRYPLCQDCGRGAQNVDQHCPSYGTHAFANDIEYNAIQWGTKNPIRDSKAETLPVYEGLRTGVSSLMCPVFGVRR